MTWLQEFFSPEIAAIFDSKGITTRKLQMLIICGKRKKHEAKKISPAERSRSLIQGSFTLLACFAKADFFISRREATLLHHLIKVELSMTPRTAQQAVQIFNRIQSIHDIESEARDQIEKLAEYWAHDKDEVQRIFNMCLAMSLCHGHICFLADKLLLKIIKDFDLHPVNYMPIREKFLHPNAEAYNTLQLGPMVDQEQIKLAWRRQCTLYHPDKMMSASDEKRSWAEQKLHQVNQAYQELKKSK
ncbi:DnaJ domain-containing protein [Lentisphaera profundi]|uniref:DnaJ domain-containing protein n=1 Tax=Lentisphaera profundi TaxID=1658616 RepID=A0ABY7W043_9BACT|nr:DnaJ domain-containing protein [Lentisphaera profundi]WDE98349.1 DnaJ domain-containing protein [Lentisphaera profundi]